VTCAPPFAARWLLPRLATYHALPGADTIALDAATAMLPAGAFDVAIRSGRGPWPDYGGVKLLAECVTPMFSPRLMSAGTRLTVKTLLKLPLLPDPHWSEWFKVAGVPNPKPKYFATRFPNYELEAQAAVNGIGAALLSPVMYADLMAQGALIAPFPWTVECRNSYWLLSTKECSESHFVKWMKSQFGHDSESGYRPGIASSMSDLFDGR
jgi:LysR family transcriptional regulator, glycine cleavage system transcriptional activator